MASDEEFNKKLREKLSEEVEEYLESEEADELVDILEVIYAICNSKNITFEELEKIRKNKAEKRGGFEKRLILDKVINKNKNPNS
jgi:predicted house-cleaning noncanonical NTP pyrophosphatase (MazG superfamily)